MKESYTPNHNKMHNQSNIVTPQEKVSDYFCIKSYLTAPSCKSLKFARLPDRCLCFLDTPLKVYSSIG